ncbi:MAG: sigma-70 family RNA polymerase sigma factor [Phaeodactylibacter sp.]|nr:sigma-70 family RNA polymerase sigma factor [Phaeodactylibacter sp.]MCB9287912.1 sigma-70 family RNA polymerase sigma factor [Lewinellaceae bacterium]
MTTTNVKPDISKISDETLADMALAGSQAAYTAIVQRHERMLRAVVTRYLKEEEEIQEALQDTFVRMYQALPGFRWECKLSSWLCRIAISVAINRYKSTKKRRGDMGIDAIPEAYHLVGIPEALERIGRKEISLWLEKALSLLSGQDASVLTAYYLQELSVDEICQATGLTESNVKTRLLRARRRLKKVVEQNFQQQLMN